MATLTVMQLLPALEAGGVERGTLEIAAALVAEGHRALVVSAGGRLVPELERLGAEHLRLDLGRKSPVTLLRARALARLIDDRRPDVVHARSRLPAWVARLALRRSAHRPAYLTTLHGLNSVSRYSAVMTRADRVIAVSQSCRDYWLQHYPALDPAQVTVIHRGIDPGAYPRDYHPGTDWETSFRSDLGLPVRAPLLCLPGRVTRLKGHGALLRLLAGLAADGSEAHGLVVGDSAGRGRYRRELERVARRLGIEQRVHFTGHRTDLREILAVCDLVLALSARPESFGRTVAEALALGRPVVGWNQGGVGEVLEHCYPEGRVAFEDERALLERVKQFLHDAPPVPEATPYTLERMQRETLALYRSAAEARAASTPVSSS